MPLSENATLAQATAAYTKNAPPWTSAAQCADFINACAVLILLVPQESGTQEGSVRYQTELYLKQQTKAEEWLDANGPAVLPDPTVRRQVRRVSFSRFRD